jgi:hypothetical protein
VEGGSAAGKPLSKIEADFKSGSFSCPRCQLQLRPLMLLLLLPLLLLLLLLLVTPTGWHPHEEL